jgi:hypothetical protein
MTEKPISFRVIELTHNHKSCEISVSINGLHEKKINASLFTTRLSDIVDEVPSDIKQIADKIQTKYSKGVAFIDAEWTGDIVLGLNTTFLGKSQFETKNREYECLSNEITISNQYRQNTKGRVLIND